MKSETPDEARPDLLQGTLHLMVLRTLALEPMHGYGIAQRIQQVSGDILRVNQGSLYPALLRLEQLGWIASKWGTSDHNRRARFYSLTRTGRRQLEAEKVRWERFAQAMARLLEA
jgi:PadR family transcriptional regulator, regulatory protein PadR